MAKKRVAGLNYNFRYFDLENETTTLISPVEGYQNLPLLPLELFCESIEYIIPDVQRRVWMAKSKCQGRISSLSDDEQASIRLYTMEWEPYHQCLNAKLNEVLRSENRQKLTQWFPYLKLFLRAVCKLPSIGMFTVRRGIKMNLSHKYTQDQIYTWYATIHI
jgi:hypothetical protein